MKACELLKFTSKPKVYVGHSQLRNGGDGLFSTGNFAKGEPMVIYYGNQLTDQQVYEIYTKNSDDYYHLSDYLRGTPNGFVIHGDKTQKNPNLQGVYVNDASSINCHKNELTVKKLRDYAETSKLCNLKVVDTSDYPIYVSIQRIKKQCELYVHYGIGYWLAHLGYSPEEISNLNELYIFDSFYH